VDIVGNGQLVKGNTAYFDQSGFINNPAVCPNFGSGAKCIDAGGALLMNRGSVKSELAWLGTLISRGQVTVIL
jgi:hypothetical protein